MTIIQIVSTVLIAITLLFLDMVCYGLLEKPIVHLLLAYYLAYSLKTDNVIILGTLIATLAVQSVLLYGRFGLILVYAIPIVFIGRQMTRAVSTSFLVYAGMVTSCFVIQHQIIDPFVLQRTPPTMRYTIGSIAVTLVLVVLFSLKLKNGRQGNRF